MVSSVLSTEGVTSLNLRQRDSGMSSITSTRFDFKFSTEFIGFNWKLSWLKTRKFLYRYSFFLIPSSFCKDALSNSVHFPPKVRLTERACYLTIWKSCTPLFFFKSKGLLFLFSNNNFITIISPLPPPPLQISFTFGWMISPKSLIT